MWSHLNYPMNSWYHYVLYKIEEMVPYGGEITFPKSERQDLKGLIFRPGFLRFQGPHSQLLHWIKKRTHASSPGWLWCHVTQVEGGSTLEGGRGKAKIGQAALVWVVIVFLICFSRSLAVLYIYAFLEVVFSRGDPRCSQEDSQNDMYNFQQSVWFKHTDYQERWDKCPSSPPPSKTSA